MLLVDEVTSMTLCRVVHKTRAQSPIIDSKNLSKDESKVGCLSTKNTAKQDYKEARNNRSNMFIASYSNFIKQHSKA